MPFTDRQLAELPFYKPDEHSPEMRYFRSRRKLLGGEQPFRNNEFEPCDPPDRKAFEGLYKGTIAGKGQSTTLAWVNLMGQLMRDPGVGKLIVPIVPDEGQTFGMPPMYKAFGIYSTVGQRPGSSAPGSPSRAGAGTPARRRRVVLLPSLFRGGVGGGVAHPTAKESAT